MGLLVSNRLHKLCSRRMIHCPVRIKLSKKNMVISRNEVAYQRVETTSNKASPPDIPQESQLYFHSHANKQHSSFDIYEKMGEIKNPKMITDQDYCGVPTQLDQQSDGLGISSQSGFIRMDLLSTCLS